MLRQLSPRNLQYGTLFELNFTEYLPEVLKAQRPFTGDIRLVIYLPPAPRLVSLLPNLSPGP